MSQKVTTGRDNLGDLAPQFAALNDDTYYLAKSGRAKQNYRRAIAVWRRFQR